ncbi:hypothetical protein N8T08_003883 [Aspergillus melleus]|uniref:Uncharacterized protein n=1 Tax=Aspergillus melleus TaxID=138277 RepID=A0ACC3B6N9_9EURO|nr:hypothetical protein N8T08_003883 [Aspergillus melleus]
MVHPMRELLDEGGLTPKSRDRMFTTFLDLKLDRHHDFITQVRDHVQKYGYKWADLEKSKTERQTCATSFVEDWGKLYWGSETNRKEHLLEESLDDPGCLCVYPDRKDEIVRAVAILLERKAKSHMRTARQSMETFATPSTPNLPVQPSSAPQPVSQPALRKENKAKRKRYDRLSQSPSPSPPPSSPQDESRRHITRKSSGSLTIRPFRDIASPDMDIIAERDKSMPRETQELTTTLSHTDAGKEPDMAGMTHFLVSISNQQGLAPTWIPFQRFTSTVSFLSHMLSECTLQYWDSHAQMLSNVQLEYPPVVVAASVKFTWSDFEIRLRQGRDEDWRLVMTQLEKAWKESEISRDSFFYDGFKVLF